MLKGVYDNDITVPIELTLICMPMSCIHHIMLLLCVRIL